MCIALENTFWDEVGTRAMFVCLFVCLMCMDAVSECLSAGAWKNIWIPGTRVMDGGKLPCHSDAEDETQILCKALFSH